MKKKTPIHKKRAPRAPSADMLGGTAETIATKIDALKETLEKFTESVESCKEAAGILFSSRNGKPMISVFSHNEVWSVEDFMDHVDSVGDLGGGKQSDEEVTIWRDAFLEAAKRCNEMLEE